MAFDNLPHYCIVFAFGALVNHVGVVGSYHRLVGRHLNHVKPVYFPEFVFLGKRGTGHAGKLLVHPEVILKGYCGESFVFLLDFDMLLGLNSLVQPVGVAPPRHEPPSKGVDYNHAVFIDHIILVAVHHTVGADSLVDMVGYGRVLGVGIVNKSEKGFGFPDAPLGKHRVSCLFVDYIIGVDVVVVNLGVKLLYHMPAQGADERIGTVIKVGRFLAGARNNQRGSRLVD